MVVTGLAVAGAIAGIGAGSRRALRRAGRTLALAGGAAGIALVLVAVVVHVRQGHTPGTERALGVAGFVAGHPATVVIAVAALVAVAAGLVTLPRSGAQGRGPDAR